MRADALSGEGTDEHRQIDSRAELDRTLFAARHTASSRGFDPGQLAAANELEIEPVPGVRVCTPKRTS